MIGRFNNFDTLNEAAATPKKYGFTYVIRDWKESMSEVMSDIRRITKKHPGFEYFDAEWNDWNDTTYTVITNYPKMEALGQSMGEDVFLADDMGDKDGIIWFDTPQEFKKIIAEGIKKMNQSQEDEDKDYEELKALGKKGEAAYKKWMKKLDDLHDMNKTQMKAAGLPANFWSIRSGWSVDSAATYMALKELGKR